MGKIIDFHTIEEKKRIERIHELKQMLHESVWEMFPTIEELQDLTGLELLLIDGQGIWYQHNPEVAARYKEKHKDQLEKLNKPK